MSESPVKVMARRFSEEFQHAEAMEHVDRYIFLAEPIPSAHEFWVAVKVELLIRNSVKQTTR